MPEANDVNFREAEERIQELHAVVTRSANLRKPTNLAARVPLEVGRAVQTAVKAVVSAVTESYRIDAHPDSATMPDSTIRVVHYTSMANAIAMLEDPATGDCVCTIPRASTTRPRGSTCSGDTVWQRPQTSG